MTTITSKLSSELRQGDIVQTNGMRVELDRPVRSYESPYSDRYGLTYSVRGRVLNHAEMEAIDAWLYTMTLPWDDSDNGEPRWTIQGNDLVSWAVEG